ncbi:hypothetical protein RhiirA5_349202 [Rhizophagus irregularis]|uniref:Uncharacterized protein n=2 Tax=Rhizophagus irregularis TaxID=588596 RepID=A0A2I1F461_9GLOM|nr:hypothetical protein RhiirA5_349202 [Rhizophagus irregularis]PKC59873.1 hypothetical protein RhiirA1_426527 [Rhizophagus irregularis]PKY29173.1 hypothetical protein RhiirB3_417770 [Rhizophagus irregularis]
MKKKKFTESDIREKLGGEVMIPRFPLEVYFKAKEIDARGIHIFIVPISTRNCWTKTTRRFRTR